MRVGQWPGEDGGHPARPVDGDVERQVGWRQRRGCADEVVHRVARPRDERGPGVGDAARVVCLEDRLRRRQAGTDSLGPPLKPAKKWGSTNPVMMRDVRLHVLALQEDWRPVHVADPHMGVTGCVVVDERIAGDDVCAHQLLYLGHASPAGASRWRRRA